MNICISFSTDNATFDHAGIESSRILKDIANWIEDNEEITPFNKNIYDINGNKIGKMVAEQKYFCYTLYIQGKATDPTTPKS